MHSKTLPSPPLHFILRGKDVVHAHQCLFIFNTGQKNTVDPIMKDTIGKILKPNLIRLMHRAVGRSV